MATAPIYIGTPKNGKVQITNADAQTFETVYTAGANGSKVSSLIGQSTDTSSRDVQVAITNGGTTYPLGTVTIPAGAGNSGSVPSVDMLNNGQLPGLPLDSDGNHYILLVSGDTLQVSALSTVTSGKLVTVLAPSVGDF